MVWPPPAYIPVPNVDLLTWVFGGSGTDPNKPLLIDAENPSRSLSLSEARSKTRKLIAGFKANGLGLGDTVCVHAYNDILYPVIFLAISGAGGRFFGSNPAYRQRELKHHFTATQPSIIITEYDYVSVVSDAVKESGIRPPKIFIFSRVQRSVPAALRSFEDLLKYDEADWLRFNDEHWAKTTIAALLVTSGTAGLHKMAKVSHRSLVNTNAVWNDTPAKPYKIRRLLSIPMFHAYCIPLAHLSPLREGIPTYIMRRYNEEKFIRAIDEFYITETAVAPPVVLRMLALSESEKHKLASLQTVYCAGARLDSKAHKKALRMLSAGARIVQIYGLTEAFWCLSFQYPEHDMTGSVGRLLPNTEAKLIDDEGEEIVEENRNGEILFRGPSVMSGYLHEDNESIIDSEGWLHSGDVGYVNGGKFYLVDRKKNIIKVRGWQVAPAELEAVLFEHPGIEDCAVIGVFKENGMDEVPRAYVVRKPGHDLQADEVRDLLIREVAKYKAVHCEVIFCESIPRNATGKVTKDSLLCLSDGLRNRVNGFNGEGALNGQQAHKV